jgi:hypothetical protein
MSKEKRNGKTESQNSVVSSAWFGNTKFITSKISSPSLSAKHGCDRPVRGRDENAWNIHAKHTKTNR